MGYTELMRSDPEQAGITTFFESASNKEVVAALESFKESRFMYGHFIDGLISGKFTPMPREKIETMVNERFFSFEPLIQLDEAQESILRTQITQELDDTINNEMLASLCGVVFEQLGGEKGSLTPKPLLVLSNAIGPCRKRSPEAEFVELSLQDKLRFFDADFWENTDVWNRNLMRQLSSQGHRSLEKYGFSNAQWLQLEQRVRATTGKKKLTVLDVGCGAGTALRDIKTLDPSIETHGLALHQEPAMYPVDEYHFFAAERIPKEFQGRFDIIISNESFRYYLFPHMALRNIVLALSKGGCADVMVSHDMLPHGEPYDTYFKLIMPNVKNNFVAMDVIFKKEFERYVALESDGKIRITVPDDFAKQHYRGRITIDKLEEMSPEELT